MSHMNLGAWILCWSLEAQSTCMYSCLFPDVSTFLRGWLVLEAESCPVCWVLFAGWLWWDGSREILKDKMVFFTVGYMHVSYKKTKWVKASIYCCSLLITLLFLWPLCHQASCCVAFLFLKLEANDFCCGCSSCSAVVVIPWLSVSVGYRPGSEWENEDFCPSEWVLWGSWMC